MNVLCIGHSAYDIYIPLSNFPIENQKYSIESPIQCGGGPAGNAAFLIAKWGMACSYAGVLGTDDYGLRVKTEYEKIGLDLRYLSMNDNCVTPISFILINSENGSRTLFNHKEEDNSQLKIIFDNHEPDTILVDGHELEASISAIKNYPNAKSILDAGTLRTSTQELARMVDYLVCSEDFAKAYTGIDPIDIHQNLPDLFEKLQELNKKQIVVTLGEKGCVYKNNDKIIHQNAYKVKAVDTTGAGDVFHGAFAYCISAGYDLAQTIKKASIAAALSVQKIGGRISIPQYKEVSDLYEAGVL